MDDITQLLNSDSSGTTSDITNQFTQIMAWMVVPSILLTIVIGVLYVMHLMHRRKIDNVILEIRDTLRDMQQNQNQPPVKDTPPLATTNQDDNI